VTVFLPRENLFFLEEWLCYHLAVGFEHFYLYDNSGSRYLDGGNSLEVTGRNRRGEAVYQLLRDVADAEVDRRLATLLAPYVRGGRVTHVRWQPRDETGQLTYGQAAAFMDYTRRFATDTEWACFTDIDEFVVPVRHPTVAAVLDIAEAGGVTYLILPQKCFAPRFDEAGQPIRRVTSITRSASWVTADFGRKALIKANTLRVPWRKAKYSIHAPTVVERRTSRLLDPGLIRFNHYKFNRQELDWVAENRGRRLELDEEDPALVPMWGRLEEIRRAAGDVALPVSPEP
jgi:hypothetical protein